MTLLLHSLLDQFVEVQREGFPICPSSENLLQSWDNKSASFCPNLVSLLSLLSLAVVKPGL